MADVNDVVSLGFGTWSSIYQLPTLGFGTGALSGVSPPGVLRRAPSTVGEAVRRAPSSIDIPIRRGPSGTETPLRRPTDPYGP